jgi:hypothetical protein
VSDLRSSTTAWAFSWLPQKSGSAMRTSIAAMRSFLAA